MTSPRTTNWLTKRVIDSSGVGGITATKDGVLLLFYMLIGVVVLNYN